MASIESIYRARRVSSSRPRRNTPLTCSQTNRLRSCSWIRGATRRRAPSRSCLSKPVRTMISGSARSTSCIASTAARSRPLACTTVGRVRSRKCRPGTPSSSRSSTWSQGISSHTTRGPRTGTWPRRTRTSRATCTLSRSARSAGTSGRPSRKPGVAVEVGAAERILARSPRPRRRLSLGRSTSCATGRPTRAKSIKRTLSS